MNDAMEAPDGTSDDERFDLTLEALFGSKSSSQSLNEWLLANSGRGSEFRAKLVWLMSPAGFDGDGERDGFSIALTEIFNAAFEWAKDNRVLSQAVVSDEPETWKEVKALRKLLRRNRMSRGLTSLALSIAGRKRASSLSAEWRGHLSGETGSGLPTRRQTRAAAAFVLASLRLRLQDLADLWWGLIDKVLASRVWSNIFLWLPTWYAVALIIRRDGTYGVITNYENLGSLTGSLFVTIHLGRRWRGVKPPKPKPRRKGE